MQYSLDWWIYKLKHFDDNPVYVKSTCLPCQW